MGVLIGEEDWKGKRVFREIIKKVGDYLKNNFSIKNIYFGVNKSNKIAMCAYSKAGFVKKRTEYIPVVAENSVTMVLEL
jgi:[ribosomal protein S5]-alanine N-acetyltransferase